MKTCSVVSVFGRLAATSCLLFAYYLRGQATSDPVVRYRLIEGSQLVDDCPVCDRIPIVAPIRGGFDLRLVSQDPLYSTYAVENLSFATTGNFTYQVSGKGAFRIGGQVAVLQDWWLDLQIDNGGLSSHCSFTNGSRFVERPWPMLRVIVDQTNGTFTQQYQLQINAAPFRELWVSTTREFKSGLWNPPTNVITGGDLISTDGRVVKRNDELCGSLGVMPVVPDLGLLDFHVIYKGDVVFSIAEGAFSEVLGWLYSGDLVTDSGTVFRRNSSLVANFDPQAPRLETYGIGAVQVLGDGEIYFSVATNFYSQNLARAIGAGDLLSSAGRVVKTGSQLLSAFQPAAGTKDPGLAAAFTWPHGETWFFTRAGFDDARSNSFAAGDLLSDQGYLIYRNAELLAGFVPAGIGQGLPLDGLYLVSDAIPLPQKAADVELKLALTNGPSSALQFSWKREGHTFQLERSSDPAGPFLPASPIILEGSYVEPDAPKPWAFYRLRRW
jgi:hypothetical protein